MNRTHCIGGWTNSTGSLDACRKPCFYQDSIPEPSRPQQVVVPSTLSQSRNHEAIREICECVSELRSTINTFRYIFLTNLFFWNHEPKLEVQYIQYIYTNFMSQTYLDGTSMHCVQFARYQYLPQQGTPYEDMPYVALENVNIFRKFPVTFVSFTINCYSLNMLFS